VYKYFAYGLNIASEIELDELIARDFIGEADIEIKLGECPEQITGEKWYGSWWQINEEHLLFYYTDVIKALIFRDGRKVTIEILTEDMFQFRSFLYSRILAACLLLRGYFLVHGACVKIGDKAVGFCGPSGVGKSTLAWSFHKHGHEVFSDDVIVLKQDAGKLKMFPGLPRLRMTEEILQELEPNLEAWEPIKHFPGKMNFTGHYNFDLEPVILEDLIVLSPENREDVIWCQVSGWEKLQLIEDARYRKGIERLIFNREDLLFRRSELANHAKFHKLIRPKQKLCVEDVLEAIIEKFN